MDQIVLCPQCGSLLVERSSSLDCCKCGRHFLKSVDLVKLAPAPYYWGEISQSEAKKLKHQAKTQGVSEAVSKLESVHPGMMEYMLSYSRADWIFSCVDFEKVNSALDIGSGWGAISLALSRHVPQVWSLESVSERIEFQQERAKQEGRKNIFFVQSDWLKLPFADNSFDLVVVNGVLEWIGLSDLKSSPRELQQKFLGEIYRVLKPGGCVYIGIENRLAFFLFLGSLDHSGLPFTSLVPRFLADFLVQRYRRTNHKYDDLKRMSIEWPDYRTYTYTKWGYQHLLSQSGFSQVNLNWALSYNSPTESGEFDGESFKFLLNHFKQHDFSFTLSGKLATKLGQYVPRWVMKYFLPVFCPSFLIFAYKGQTPLTFEKRLIKLIPGSTSFIRRSGTHGITSKVNYFLLKNGQPTHVAKFARFPDYDKSLSAEEKLLQKWGGIKVRKCNLERRTVFIENYLQGRICQTHNLSDNLSAVEWLIQFQKKTHIEYWKTGKFQNYCTGFINLLDKLGLSKPVTSQVRSLLSDLSQSTTQVRLPYVSEHGDFVKTNIIFDSHNKIHVIDWEFFKSSGSPLFDLLTFIIQNSRVGDNLNGLATNFTGHGPYSSTIKIVVEKYSRAWGIPIWFIVQSIPLMMVRTLSRRFFDNTGRHLDTLPMAKLLEKWCEIHHLSSEWIM